MSYTLHMMYMYFKVNITFCTVRRKMYIYVQYACIVSAHVIIRSIQFTLIIIRRLKVRICIVERRVCISRPIWKSECVVTLILLQ